MFKQIKMLKNNRHISQCVSEFFNKLIGMGIAKNQVKGIERAFWNVLVNIKEYIYRMVDLEYLREDLMSQIEENYGDKGLLLASCVPMHVLDKIIEDWQEDLSDSDMYFETYWDYLRDRLSNESWLSDLKKFTHKDIAFYKCYLTDWYENHKEGFPASIQEFFDNEMSDDDTRKYYIALENKRNGNYG